MAKSYAGGVGGGGGGGVGEEGTFSPRDLMPQNKELLRAAIKVCHIYAAHNRGISCRTVGVTNTFAQS